MLCACPTKACGDGARAQRDSVCAARDFTPDARSLLESFICRLENTQDCTSLECDNSIQTDKLLSLRPLAKLAVCCCNEIKKNRVYDRLKVIDD